MRKDGTIDKDDVKDLKEGDLVTGVFMELSPDVEVAPGLYELGYPTGNTYEITGTLFLYCKSLNLSDDKHFQCVSQEGGWPGGWLVSITKHETN